MNRIILLISVLLFVSSPFAVFFIWGGMSFLFYLLGIGACVGFIVIFFNNFFEDNFM